VGTTSMLLLIAAVWMLIGITTAVVMGRRGYHAWSWLVMAAALGPLVIPLALTASRRPRTPALRILSAGLPGPGEVDVLVGIDGSKDAIAALHAATDLMGSRLGRLTLAGVLDRDTAETPGMWDERRRSEEALRNAVTEVSGAVPSTILLEGPPAQALMTHAVAEGYELIVIGRRGRGASTALLGSVATTLARGSDAPVLIV
jgi:nucleotide-binding universal stress UspA family protein